MHGVGARRRGAGNGWFRITVTCRYQGCVHSAAEYVYHGAIVKELFFQLFGEASQFIPYSRVLNCVGYKPEVVRELEQRMRDEEELVVKIGFGVIRYNVPPDTELSHRHPVL